MLATPPSTYNNTSTIKKPVNSTTRLPSTPENKTVIRLPDNIDHLPVKI